MSYFNYTITLLKIMCILHREDDKLNLISSLQNRSLLHRIPHVVSEDNYIIHLHYLMRLTLSY